MSVMYYGTERIRQRDKRCHELAAHTLAVKATMPGGTVLVCGEAGWRDHSWLELPDGTCWDPVSCELAGGPDGGTTEVTEVYYRLTMREVARAIRATRHYGSWTEQELKSISKI